MEINYHSLWNGCSVVCMLLLVDAPAFLAALPGVVSLGTDYAKYRYRLPIDGEVPRYYFFIAIIQSCLLVSLFLLIRLLLRSGK